MFTPLRTERLLLRAARLEDAEALAARRSDPHVAEYQNWTAPFTIEAATALLDGVTASDEPKSDEWFMITIADEADIHIYGDLALHLEWDGCSAEVGYTLAAAHWGCGYATEAVAGLVEWLFSDPRFTRVHADLHPDNVASAMVLERTGFVFEGHTRLSYWVGDDNSDGWHYGMTRADYESWTSRPTQRAQTVELAGIDPSSAHVARQLVTHKSQERLVSPVLASFADALFPEVIDGAPVVPWMRLVVADGEPAGFVMVAEPTEAHPEPYLWRLLIDRRHQRRGIGTKVIDAVVDQTRSWGVGSLILTFGEGRGSPRPVYERYGFVPTGKIVEGETEMRYVLP